MKRVISTPRLVLLFSYVILIARASAEVSEGLKNAINSHSQRRQEARRLNVTIQNIQSQPAQDLGSFDDRNSVNWGGAVQPNIPQYGGHFYAIDNTQWIIPNVRLPPDANKEPVFGVAAWVGIDGTGSCTGRVLQAGSLSIMKQDDSGKYNTEVNVWVEWYPDSAYEVPISVNTGHTVQVSILATSPSQGLIEITNLSTGVAETVAIKSPGDAYNLCGLTVEYIVEAPFNFSANARLPLLQFDDFQFVNCLAETTDGDTVDLTGASSVTLVNQNGVVLASPNIVSATEVQVTYVSSGLSKG